MPLSAARNLSPECWLASSIASRVSLVYLQKLTFQACVDPRSMKMFAPAQNTRSFRLVTTTVGMLEADAVDRVGQLDVDAEIVRVQLQAVIADEAAVLLHIHRQRRDGPVEGEPPVPIAIRRGLERHVQRSGLRDGFHRLSVPPGIGGVKAT